MQRIFITSNFFSNYLQDLIMRFFTHFRNLEKLCLKLTYVEKRHEKDCSRLVCSSSIAFVAKVCQLKPKLFKTQFNMVHQIV